MKNKIGSFSGYAQILIAITLISSFALTLFGLYKLPWPQSMVWSGTDSIVRFVGFATVAAILVSVFSWRLQRNTGVAALLVAALLAIVAGAVWPFLVVVWFAVASSMLGYWLLGRLKITDENWINCVLVGVGVYGTLVGLLAHFPVNYPGGYGVALALPLVLGWRVLVDKSKAIITYFNNEKAIAKPSVNWLDVVIAVIGLVYLVVALMPEVGFDALASHLVIPVHLALRHQWMFDASMYVWAVMPALGDFIFSIGYMLAGEAAARLINVGFIFILAWLLRSLVLWAGGSIVGARWAVLIFLSTPLTFIEGNSLYIESVWASFAVAGTLAMLSACSAVGKPKFELPIAGFLLGCALASKAVTSSLLIPLFLILIWRYKSWFKKINLVSLLLALGFFLVIGVIPYATAWHLTGNPVFPLFNKIFKSPFYSASSNFSTKYSDGISWDFIYSATFQTTKYLEAAWGACGFQWLLLFPSACLTLLIFRNSRQIELLFVGVVSILITCQGQAYLRYLFPSWVILVAVIGIALCTEINKWKIIRWLWWTTSVFTIILNIIFFTAGPYYKDFATYSITDAHSRDAYLLNSQPIRRAVQLVNSLNDTQSPVAVFSDPLAAGLSGDYLYPGWYNLSFVTEIRAIQSEQDLTNMLINRGVSFVILDSNWNGINCCPDEGKAKQALVEKVTEKIAEFGALSVRKVNTGYNFKTEILRNPNFTSINGWGLSPDAKYDPETHSILVNVNSPASQTVVVSTGRRYLNTIVARCAKEPTAGRLQINWHDAKGQFVSADINTFDCSPAWTEHTMQATAPPNAVNATVYTTGHTPIPLEFKSNSLKQ